MSANVQTVQTDSAIESGQNARECPECGQACHYHNGSGEIVCQECSVVLGDQIRRDRTPVYHHSNLSDKVRTGGVVRPGEVHSGIGTEQIPGGAWTHGYDPHYDSRSGRLRNELSDIEHFGVRLEFEQYEIECAKRWYSRAHSADLIRGRSVAGFIAACLLAGVRKSKRKVPILTQEIRQQTPATKQQFRSARTALEQELELGIEPVSAQELVIRARDRLNVNHAVVEFAQRLLKQCEQKRIDLPITPQTRAAVAVAVACEVLPMSDIPTQVDIAEALSISKSTLSTRKQSFVDSSGELIERITTETEVVK